METHRKTHISYLQKLGYDTTKGSSYRDVLKPKISFDTILKKLPKAHYTKDGLRKIVQGKDLMKLIAEVVPSSEFERKVLGHLTSICAETNHELTIWRELDYIGHELESGVITVMRALGKIYTAGEYAGYEMKDGLIRVNGKAGSIGPASGGIIWTNEADRILYPNKAKIYLGNQADLQSFYHQEAYGRGKILDDLLRKMDNYDWSLVKDISVNNTERKNKLKNLKKIIEHSGIKLDGSVLEFDTGPISIGSFYRDLIAVDNNPRSVKCLRKEGIRAIIGTIDELPFEDNSFDCVIAFSPLIVREKKGIRLIDKESGEVEVTSEYKDQIVRRAIEIAREKVLLFSAPIAVDPPFMERVEKNVLRPHYYVVYDAKARQRITEEIKEIKEKRILLEYCSKVNARTAEERVVTSDNIGHFSKRYPDQEISLHQWIPFEAPNAHIDMYIKRGGYKALEKALTMKSEQIITEVKDSGLIGRGGAGFPTGPKWEMVNKASGDEKYLICNADEGEPGTFKDKVLLDEDPHKVIEGMIIAAYAIGSSKGYIYVRGEYPDSAEIIERAVKEAETNGFLGANIRESSFSFYIKIFRGMGAYICGEETALLNSIEGKRGIPRIKPPYPTISGLHRKPTVINNVETLANIPHIILNGASWFRSFGVEGSFGTKLFSISGNVKNPGVYEVELGKYTLGDLIYGLADGIEGNRRLKTVLPGGASTRFLTEDNLDVRMDYRSLEEAGSSLGTGAIIVFDETTSIPEIVRHFFDFYLDESCGDCVPCRLGTKMINEILYSITEPVRLEQLKDLYDTAGPEKKSYLEQLQDIGTLMKKASKCGLGQAASNPLLSSIELFKHEYYTLIQQRQREYEHFVEKMKEIEQEFLKNY